MKTYGQILFVHPGARYQAPAASASAVVGAILYKLSGGLILTKAAARYRARRSNSWALHASRIQSELDAERARGYGYRADNGKRIDF